MDETGIVLSGAGGGGRRGGRMVQDGTLGSQQGQMANLQAVQWAGSLEESTFAMRHASWRVDRPGAGGLFGGPECLDNPRLVVTKGSRHLRCAERSLIQWLENQKSRNAQS